MVLLGHCRGVLGGFLGGCYDVNADTGEEENICEHICIFSTC